MASLLISVVVEPVVFEESGVSIVVVFIGVSVTVTELLHNSVEVLLKVPVADKVAAGVTDGDMDLEEGTDAVPVLVTLDVNVGVLVATDVTVPVAVLLGDDVVLGEVVDVGVGVEENVVEEV